MFHHQEVNAVGLFGIVGGYDIWVRQMSGRFYLSVKSLDHLGVLHQLTFDHLQRNRSVHHSVLRLIDLPHTSPSNQFGDLVPRVFRKVCQHIDFACEF